MSLANIAYKSGKIKYSDKKKFIKEVLESDDSVLEENLDNLSKSNAEDNLQNVNTSEKSNQGVSSLFSKYLKIVTNPVYLLQIIAATIIAIASYFPIIQTSTNLSSFGNASIYLLSLMLGVMGVFISIYSACWGMYASEKW